MYQVQQKRSWIGWLLAATVLLLPVGCGEEDTTPTNVTTTDQQDVQNGINSLQGFGEEVLSGDGAQLAQNAQLLDLLGSVGFPGLDLAIPFFRYAPGLLAKQVVWRKASRMRPHPAIDLDNHFGTYHRDVNDFTEPFPGWVLDTADDPPNGLIFEFTLQDDIHTYDDMGNEVPLQGAIRFLEIEVDAGVPEDPNDDILTNIIVEVAALSVLGTPPTLLRGNLNIVLDEMREPMTITLGSPEANSTLHPDAAFVGNLLVAVSIDITPVPAKPNSNLAAFAQLFDSVDNFALRFDLSMTNFDMASSLPPESASISFGFGNTTNPSMPPWVFQVTASQFVEDPLNLGSYNSDITGSITFNTASVATFSGNTQEVPVDLDGDTVPDGQCPDINVTFDDDPENASNLCVALPMILELLNPAP